MAPQVWQLRVAQAAATFSLVLLQRSYEWTFDLSIRGAALVNEVSKRSFNPLQITESITHVTQLLFGKDTRLIAVSAVIER